MATENKARIRRLVQAWNDRDLVSARELFDVDRFVWHGPNDESSDPGFSDQGLRNEFAAFPDIRYEIADVIAEGDKVVVRLVEPATFTGEWLGIPPTGNRVTLRGTSIFRFERGKIVEEWDRWDTVGLLLELGVGSEGLAPIIREWQAFGLYPAAG